MSDRRSGRLAAALLLGLSPAWAAAADPQHWLDRMSESLRSADYAGTFVHVNAREGQLQTMQVVHAHQGGVERERLVALSGPRREIVRTGGECRCAWPDRERVIVGRYTTGGFAPRRLARFGELGEHYALGMAGSGRVAGLAARIVEIRPRDRYRYGYRLWLEAERAMLLRADMLDIDGRTVEQTAFTRFEYLERVDPARLESAHADADFHEYRRMGIEAESDPVGDWQVNELPPGYVLEGEYLRRNPRTGRPMKQWVYSDGLSTVSLFIEPAGKEAPAPAERHRRYGCVNIFRSAIDDFRVTVVGEVPAPTVSLIGESVGRGGRP